MPVVPVVTAPRGSSSPLGATRRTAIKEDGLGQLANVAGDAAKTAEAFGRAKAQADIARVDSAEAAFDDVRATLDRKFRELKGDNALRLSGDFHKKLADERANALKALASDDQRRIFERRTERSLLSSRRSLEEHSSREAEQWSAQAFAAVVEGKKKEVAANYGNDDIFEQDLKDSAKAVANRASVEGMSQEAFEQFKAAHTAGMHEARLLAAIDAGDAKAARAILEKAPPELSKHRPRVERMGLAADSEAKAADIWVQSMGKGEEFADVEYALSAVEALAPDDPRKQAVRSLVAHRVSQQDAVKRRRAREVFDEMDAARLAGRPVSSPEIQQRVALLSDPKLGATRELRAWLAAEARLLKIRSGGSGGAEARRQQKAADDFAKAAYHAAEDVEARSQDGFPGESPELAELREAVAAASPTARKEIRAAQLKDRKTIEGGGLLKWTVARDLAKAEAKSIGLLKNDKKAAAFAAHWAQWYDDFRTRENREPTRQETRAELGELLLIGDQYGGSFWSGNKRQWETGADEQWNPLPADDQDSELAREALGRRGSAPAPRAAPAAPSPERPRAKVVLEPMTVGPGGKVAAIAEIRAANPEWTPEQVTAALRSRGF